jgi:hypothetical protein
MASRRYQRRNVVACGNCGANYDASGQDPRCPACDARLADYEPGTARPAVRGYSHDLEGPDLLRAYDEPPETAPLEEFIAAGLVLLAFVLMVTGVFTASPLVLNLGLGLFALAGIGFGLFKLYQFATGKRKRRDEASEAPSMLDWLIGRGFWDRFR